MKSFLLIFIIFSSIKIYSQSTQTSLNFGKNNDFHSDKIVSETTTNRTFYNRSGTTERTKEVKSYNTQNNVIAELRYDEDNNLKQRLTRIYDSTGTRCLARKFENWHRYLGHSIETAIYTYDSKGFLINASDKNQKGQIYRQTNFINNDKGDPIEIINFNGEEIIGKEKNEYNYDKNEVTIKYCNKNNELLSSQTSTIDYSKVNSDDIVNEHGDIIKSATYETEIKYDKFGNWIKEKHSVIRNGKLTKQSETSRTIKYLN
ncbi:hypothetical protein [Flavobacterium reichenbachii]|uniref:Uncharacterized protein n=1 Tax=Flavobacterium reichenbachii TaxID=362418 RepID=A0A085ZQM7_9FLAO|nr:hypothetical protein [Flavobacterium reichenbachii]KFF06741.1 hypothetical protein IW19_15055 [Flavobacterium reichenbachii]OXB18655.1 hypothetical protein B0A68_01155 [Flavobacterium reichenbachii]